MKKLITVPLLFVSSVAGLYTLLRPRLMHWGATRDEVERPLPGDELVQSPKRNTTRAITIDAPPADVWPWLLQIGQDRGGFYSYDWLENLAGLNIHTAREIRPEWQTLKVGDKIRLMPENPDVDLAFEVNSLQPEKALVLLTPGDLKSNLAAGFPYGTWAFVLDDIGGGRTRLIVRFRADFKRGFASILVNQIMTEPLHFIMERKMLLTFKELAETTVDTSLLVVA